MSTSALVAAPAETRPDTTVPVNPAPVAAAYKLFPDVLGAMMDAAPDCATTLPLTVIPEATTASPPVTVSVEPWTSRPADS